MSNNNRSGDEKKRSRLDDVNPYRKYTKKSKPHSDDDVPTIGLLKFLISHYWIFIHLLCQKVLMLLNQLCFTIYLKFKQDNMMRTMIKLMMVGNLFMISLNKRSLMICKIYSS